MPPGYDTAEIVGGSKMVVNTNETLWHVQRYISGRIILIWDRARIHTSKKVQEYTSKHPEIRIELSPAHAPELDPEEWSHVNIKQHPRNARPSNKNEIRSMLDRGFADVCRRPGLLLGFFHAAGPSVGQLW